MFCVVKMEKYPSYVSKRNSKWEKINHSVKDSKQRRMALYCNKKIACIIEKNNVKIQ